MVGGGAVTTLGVATLLFLACKQAGHIPLCYLFLYAVAIGRQQMAMLVESVFRCHSHPA